MTPAAPSPRLLGLTAALGLPLALAAPWMPEALGLLQLSLGALALVAVADLFLPLRALDALTLRQGGLLRLARGRHGVLTLWLGKPGVAGPVDLQLALELPDGVEADLAVKACRLPAGDGPFGVAWGLSARQRGAFKLPLLRVELRSLAGLWLRRRSLPLDAEIKVAPSLGHERRALAHYLLRRGGGVRALRVSGQGREFDKLRETNPGDAFNDIDWKATARKGKPVSRVYQVERTQELTVLLDASRLSARPSNGGAPGDSVLESHLRAALALQLACAAQGDRFGLIAFGGKVLGQAAASSGAAAQRSVTELLSRLQPDGASPDYHELATAVAARRGRRGLLVLLACLDDPLAGEQCLAVLPELCRRHVVLALSPKSQGAEPAFSRELRPDEDLADALAAQWRYKGLRRLGQGMRALGAHLAWVREERLAQEAVSLYVKARERQWV